MEGRLVRSATDRMIGGVCGGLARYLGIDSLWVRLFFVLLALGNSFGFWLYLLLWVVMPSEEQWGWEGGHFRANVGEIVNRAQGMRRDVQRSLMRPHPQSRRIIGGVMVLVGAVWLLNNILESFDIYWLRWLSLETLWPLLLVVAGIVLLVRRASVTEAVETGPES